ncbi:MAG: DNA gyrase subunit A [Thermodesulfobacteriota bacterium]|nr:MAG: DNA gyrase subunit A [Thermodesulfobacteriota bacterium]
MLVDQRKIPVNIEDEMRRSYMDYAMSVIIGRALPDVRDGLKPVHRRILFAMHDTGNTWNKPYKKSARIVGDVIGKYHPHGDAAAYDSIVRLAQDFSLRYPLVDGQGNFGSIDGDSAAAMRYTEIRMTPLAGEMLQDLDKETVEFSPNYDETLLEPMVLPTRIPQLIINGSSGIAVGMATNIPPHNLSEVTDALIALIKDPDISIAGLMEYVIGPDFPSGAFIYGRGGIKAAYSTGKGIIRLRARAFIERKGGDRESIVVSELPYQVNKARLLEKIAELIRDKKIIGIADLRDESDRHGVRVVIELKKDAIAQVVFNQLYQHTQMQITFGVIMLAIVRGQPKLLTLKEMLEQFVRYRKEVVHRRTAFELRKAEERAHILEGLKKALDNLDAVISLIRKSGSPSEARANLISTFDFTEVQAQAILDMRLQRLTAMEQGKIIEEYQGLLKQIERYKQILANERLLLEIIIEELNEIKKKYGDPRRTEIVEEAAEIDVEDLIVEEDMVVSITHSGYIKRSPVSLYRSQQRGGKGSSGMVTKEDDFVEHIFVASTHSYILFFTSSGRVYWLKVHQLPESGRATKGKALVNLLELPSGEKISAFLSVKEFEEGKFIVMATKKGVIKKSSLMDYSKPRRDGIIGLDLDEGDELIAAALTDGKQDILLCSEKGKSIRFPENQARSLGRVTRGVKGVELASGDSVVGMVVISSGNDGFTILTVTEHGYGKRTNITEYRAQGRGGSGIINIQTPPRNGDVVGVKQVTDEDDLILINNRGRMIRIGANGIPIIGRNTKGVRLITLESEEKVVGVARLAEKD